MNWASALPAPLLRWITQAWPDPSPAQIEALTGLSEEGWRAIARVLPGLGAKPGLDAARARRTFTVLAAHAIGQSRSGVRWDPSPPPATPALYLTIHLGSLRTLRYLLRREGIAIGVVVDETHFGDPSTEDRNARFDRSFPHDFPHTFDSRRPHRLRGALRRGSLVLAIDRIHRSAPAPPRSTARIPFLGGTLEIELGPLRLARVAGVPARPIFITAPRGRLTITVGDPLPADPDSAAARFADVLGRAAGRSPADFDGYTHRFLNGPPAGATTPPR